MAISTLYPSSRPSLSLDFAKSKRLDPRIAFSRTHTGSIASYTDSNGLIRFAGADEPRFDHDPVTGESLGLLLEESRTNLFEGNHNPVSYFSGGASKSNVNIILPSGETGTALETDANAFSETYENLTASSNTSPGYLTFYAKKKSAGSTGTLTITMEGGGTARSFNSVNINSDTWTKISTTHDWSSANATLRRFDIYFNGSGNTSDGDTFFYISFIQFEEGAFPTSYISTSGSAVTRPGDAVTMEVGPEDNKLSIQDFNSNGEGTLLCEFTDSDGVGSNVAAAFSAGTHNGTSFLAIGSNSNFEPFIRNRVNGTNEALLSESSLDTSVGFVKVGFIIDQDFNKIVTSSGVLEDTSVSYDTNPYNKLIIGRDQITSDNNRIFGTIKKITFYSSSLSVSNLQTLTK